MVCTSTNTRQFRILLIGILPSLWLGGLIHGFTHAAFKLGAKESVTRCFIFDRMSEECIGALVSAQNEAPKYEMSEVGPEVAFLGLIDRPEGARRTLKEYGLNLRLARNALSTLKKSEDGGDSASSGNNMAKLFNLQSKARDADLPFSQSLRKRLSKASEEAAKLNSETINSEHVLLTLLGEPADEDVMKMVNLMSLDKEFSPTTFRKRLIANLEQFGSGSRLELATGEGLSSTPTLEEIGVDLTDLAKQQKLDHVYGRDKEINQALRTLTRRRKNNPCLVGEPGVGKTAIAEGIAQIVSAADLLANPQELEQYYEDISDDDYARLEKLAQICPKRLRGYRIISIELANLVAGTKYRGEFEERVQSILEEVMDEKAPPTILFMDEIHLLIGAGKADGGMDAANVLKPALSRGQLQLIGATTISEYRQYIESDAALERRLQPLMVKEPSLEQSLEIVKTLLPSYEKHFEVKYSDECLQLAVSLSERYIKDRFMPDKALDVIDEAGALASSRREEIVTEKDVLTVISEISSVPVSGLQSDSSTRVLELQNILQDRVVGQPAAVKSIVKCLKRYHAGMRDSNRPVGCFMFAGPTGTGKTEICKQLAKSYFTSKSDLIRLDMSEFMESHTVSKLIGPPPGYIGYEAGGVLTNAVRKNPHSIVLLDEFEKAHPDVWNTLLQIMEDGILTDGKGRTVYFRDAIVVLTSNAGSKRILEVSKNHPDASNSEPTSSLIQTSSPSDVQQDEAISQDEIMKKVRSNPKALAVIQEAMKDKELLTLIQSTYNTPADMSSNPKIAGFLSEIWEALDLGGSLDDEKFLKGIFSQVDDQAKKIEQDSSKTNQQSSWRVLNSEMYAEMVRVVKEELQSIIRPEILNRLDDIIVFEPLTKEALTNIANLLLSESKERAGRDRKLKFTVATPLLNHIVLEGGSNSQYGARPMRRAVQKYFEDTVSEAIVNSFLSDEDDVVVDLSPCKNYVKIVRMNDGESFEVELDNFGGGIDDSSMLPSANGSKVNSDDIPQPMTEMSPQ